MHGQMVDCVITFTPGARDHVTTHCHVITVIIIIIVTIWRDIYRPDSALNLSWCMHQARSCTYGYIREYYYLNGYIGYQTHH